MSVHITDLAQDKIGYLWVATQDEGIVRFDGLDFLSFKEKEGLISNKVNALKHIHDSLFIATDKGLTIKIKQQFISIPSIEILNISHINNTVLLATKQGIYSYKKGAIIPLKLNDQIDLSPVNDIAYYNGGYYIASPISLWYIDRLDNPSKIKRVTTGEYTSLTVIDGKLFATTNSQGVQVFENSKSRFIFQNVRRVTSIQKFQNNYWLSTDNNGVFVYNSTFDFEKKISKYNGLKVNHIRHIFIDRSYNCWLATFGNGLYKYAATPIKSALPTIYFENIEVDYQSVDSIPINAYSKSLYLKPTQNNISFSFRTVDTDALSKLEYRWILNDNTSPWTYKTTVDFARLHAGEYTFKVQSRNAQMIESKPIHFSFFIDTPIYKKQWFIYSALTAILFIVFSIIALLFHTIKKKNKKKVQQLRLENHLLSLEQKALQLQMNPHFVFNVLHGIKALGNQQDSEEMNKAIDNFAGLLRGVLQNSRKEEISLQQEIEVLKKYVALELQMAAKSFIFNVNTESVSIDLDEILIPPMLIQPFIENAIKHGIPNDSTDGVITLRFEIKDVFLICIITDNGVGYKHSKENLSKTSHKSIALQVTKERIESISGKQSFYISEIKKEQPLKGTKVWFRIPLKTEF
jgi:hypothetical protein